VICVKALEPGRENGRLYDIEMPVDGNYGDKDGDAENVRESPLEEQTHGQIPVCGSNFSELFYANEFK
jgi:hypothetical protein